MQEFQERYKVIGALFVLGGLVLLINLFVLQVVKSEYQDQAQSRTLTKRTLIPSRGIISDRHGRLIVVNEPAYELQIIYSEIPADMNVKEFCKLLGITEKEYSAALENVMSKPYFRKNLPIRLLGNIDPTDFSFFQEHLHEYPGFYPVIGNKRHYPFPHAAHVLGFLGEVNNEDIAEHPERFEIGDYRGMSGLENKYDSLLRGIKGMELLLKDNLGREIEPYLDGSLDTSAVNGKSLRTGLDIVLQAYGETLFANKRGSIVAIEPGTGEILTMLSSPSFDPNALSLGRLRNATYQMLLEDTASRPLFDRSLQAKYPPGSIFKPVLSLIALQEGTTYSNRPMTCTGEYVINARRGYVQKCRDHPKPINLPVALQYSCNSYFFQLIREIIDQFGTTRPEQGLNLLNDYLGRFGLGQKLGVDLMNEGTGFIPTPAFYENIYLPQGAQWRSTYILSLGIGQGELELTTLQMANLAAVLANRGYYITPHVVSGLEAEEKTTFEKHYVGVEEKHFEPVIDGMQRVIDSGTGFRAAVPGLEICGKTGTSQNPHGLDHSVFFGFAPKEDPKIAIAVFVENAGGGGTVAAPIAGLMMEMYLRGEIAKRRKYLEDYILDMNLQPNP